TPHRPVVPIAIVGKYTSLSDAYLSVVESLKHAAVAQYADVQIRWVESVDIEAKGAEKYLKGVAGILIPGGFGNRGIEGKILAAQYARENKIPYLGLCLGMHIAVIEFARHILKIEKAHSAEFNRKTPDPVIDLMGDQKGVSQKGGTMRLGAYPCKIKKGSKL